MIPPTPLVSVIVVNWNRLDLLRACLKSLRAQSFQNFETIVVDNGSTDGSPEMLRGSAAAELRVIENSENRGFCAANNQGIAASRGEFVALLNNDAAAAPDWLEQLVSVIRSRPGIGMAASKILTFERPQVIDKVGHLIYLDGQNRGRATGQLDQGQYEEIEETAWPDGCAALYSKRMLDEIGGFDEDFFAYADDAELGLRARLAGWGCLYAPKAVAYHRTGTTLGRYSAERLFLIERNRVWLATKLFPWRLLALNPFYFALRVAATAWAGLGGRGEASRAAASLGAGRLLQCLIKAQWAALTGLPKILRKRRGVNRLRRLSGAETAALIRRFRIPLRDLARGAR